MARKNAIKVFEAFARGEATNQRETLWTDGQTIYSYRAPIAWAVIDDSGRLSGIEVTAERFSVTTSCHQSGIRELASRAGLAVTVRE